MADPAAYLPPALDEGTVQELLRSVGLPEARQVQHLQVSAAYHSVYFIHFDEDQTSGFGAAKTSGSSNTLVLRVAGRHLPRIKTLNEAGVITWVREHTSIPVPAVVRYDASENNPLGHEYVLLQKADGVSVDKIYDSLGEDKKQFLVEQLTDHLIQLHSQPWEPGFVGGLIPDGTGSVTAGPPIDETFWQLPDIPKHWGPGETLATLNPLTGQPFPSWTSYASACLDRYIHAIATHHSLAPFRYLAPRLAALRLAITTPPASAALDAVPCVIAHRDLHFGNIMCDPRTARVTGVLDWEFAGVVPAPRWNPVRAFLWNYQNTPEANAEKYRLVGMFEAVCRDRGAEWLLGQMRMSEAQEAMNAVVNHVRAIVEICPRGEGLDRVEGWREVVEAGLKTFGL